MIILYSLQEGTLGVRIFLKEALLVCALLESTRELYYVLELVGV